ncbi:MAG: sigma-70 family RNA polymerase sigma factor [Leptospirales bacterium]|nr:sigma-70 family RNA polymerase sigma factor [Leptospirales bacterium]
MLEAQAGNEKSYERLLRELADAAGSYAGKRISDESHVADFSQDVLLAVHRARHTFQGSRLFSPWFFAIVKNRFIDMIRATRRRPVEFASEEAVGLVIARDPDWVARDAIQEAIARLPDVQQKVLRLQMHGSSIQEMAAELDLGISATKVRAHRARKALEKLLRQDYEFD